jgi:hypothetical protein
MRLVFDRPPLEQGCLKTDSNRTTTPIDHNDVKVVRTGLRNQTGFFMTGDGTSNEHKRVMNEKGLAYAMVIRNSTLQRG